MNGKRYWRLVALIPDQIAHETMSRVASTKGSIVEEFVPALVGPTDEATGMPTSKQTGPEFLAEYAARHRTFNVNDAKAAGAELGINSATIASAIQKLRLDKQLKRAGNGKDKGMWTWIGAKKPKRTADGKVAAGAAEAATLERLGKNGAAVSIPDITEAVVAAGGSAKSISGMIDRMKKQKKIKRVGPGMYARA